MRCHFKGVLRCKGGKGSQTGWPVGEYIGGGLGESQRWDFAAFAGFVGCADLAVIKHIYIHICTCKKPQKILYLKNLLISKSIS